ncbi:MAG TPA: sigma-70 family RNA polymerase sigma factor [Clostridiales bacterium]|jgi:RNA polymerase sigma-70 factor (ECF subfamily)|nr:sigma-70 family RNA polymerase sigma factor [Clostridiales bacterium]HRT82217.1 sigma-70 family RNA polymerase sigma factor [Oscillospiraceae bacterium]
MGVSKYISPGTSEIYDRYADMLFRIACAELHSDEDAQDAIHDVFVKYISKSPIFNSEEHEKAWFIRVTINLCHDMQRHRAVVNKNSPPPTPDCFQFDSDEGGVMESVLSLPEKYKTVILLFFFEEQTIECIASSLGISVSAVKMRLSRAKALLKKSGIGGENDL